MSKEQRSKAPKTDPLREHFPLIALKERAASARAYADMYVELGENANGVSYECLDHYARGLEDAVRLVLDWQRAKHRRVDNALRPKGRLR